MTMQATPMTHATGWQAIGPRLVRTVALSLALLLPAAAVPASDAVPAGYALEDVEDGVRLIFEGETVFETTQPGMLLFARVTGPHDMNGDGIPDLVIYERIGRSMAQLTVFSLAPDGPDMLMQNSGMAVQMRGFESVTEDTDLSALLAQSDPTRDEIEFDLRSAPEPEPEAAGAGAWRTTTGTWEEGFAAKMGWVVPEFSETEYAAMLFRCPDNGDPFWVEPLIFHDTREDVPRRVLLDLDGTPVSLPVAPQMDDPRSDQWYAIGTLPRDTALFSQMAEAERIVMHYADLAPFDMTGGAAAPEQREQIARFIAMCGN